MTFYCKYGCQTAIKFDNSRISVNGKKIPLNLDNTIHDCPKRLLLTNKVKLPCKYCTQPITFDNNIKAKSGKMIPLNSDKSYHNCAKSPYGVSKRHVLDNKQEDTVKPSLDDIPTVSGHR